MSSIIEKICELPEGYKPSENEEFMNDFQREYFRRKLVQWRKDLLTGEDEVFKVLQDDTAAGSDPVDKASSETDMAYELRTKERTRKLIIKIDEALLRIKNGSYGYCDETGDEISLKRLEARPVAVLSLEAQERHEKQERVQKDD